MRRRVNKKISIIQHYVMFNSSCWDREERNSGGVFVKLPFHYIEISSLLLKYARDDMQSPEELATLLRDIEDIRMDRLKIAMVEEIANKVKNAEKVVYLNVENLSSMEILSVKRFVLESMSVFTRLTAVEPEVREVRDARGNIFSIFRHFFLPILPIFPTS